MSDKKLTINQHREQAYADGLAFGRSLCACHKAEVLAAYKAAAAECKRSETIWRSWKSQTGIDAAEAASGLADRINLLASSDRSYLNIMLAQAKEEGRQEMRDELSAAVKVLLNWKENMATDDDVEEAKRRTKLREECK